MRRRANKLPGIEQRTQCNDRADACANNAEACNKSARWPFEKHCVDETELHPPLIQDTIRNSQDWRMLRLSQLSIYHPNSTNFISVHLRNLRLKAPCLRH